MSGVLGLARPPRLSFSASLLCRRGILGARLTAHALVPSNTSAHCVALPISDPLRRKIRSNCLERAPCPSRGPELVPYIREIGRGDHPAASWQLRGILVCTKNVFACWAQNNRSAKMRPSSCLSACMPLDCLRHVDLMFLLI